MFFSREGSPLDQRLPGKPVERQFVERCDGGRDVGDPRGTVQLVYLAGSGGEDGPGVAVGVVAGAAAAVALAVDGAEVGGVEGVEGDGGGGAPADHEVGEAVGGGALLGDLVD